MGSLQSMARGSKLLEKQTQGDMQKKLVLWDCLNDRASRWWVADSNNVWGHATCGVWDQGQEAAGGCHRKAATGKLVTPTEDLEDIGKANCGSNFGSHKAGGKQLPHDPVSYVGL